MVREAAKQQAEKDKAERLRLKEAAKQSKQAERNLKVPSKKRQAVDTAAPASKRVKLPTAAQSEGE